MSVTVHLRQDQFLLVYEILARLQSEIERNPKREGFSITFSFPSRSYPLIQSLAAYLDDKLPEAVSG